MLAIIKIPEHGLSVLATGGTQGTVRRHGDGVQVTTVSNVVGLELAVGQVPDLTSKTKKLNKNLVKINLKDRTLTYLSQPQETMMGFWLLGENLTQDTHSV